jgi:hypothetical protein
MYDSQSGPPLPLVQNVDFHVWLAQTTIEEAREYLTGLTNAATLALVRVVPVQPVMPELGKVLYRVTSVNSYEYPAETAAISLAVELINAQPDA